MAPAASPVGSHPVLFSSSTTTTTTTTRPRGSRAATSFGVSATFRRRLPLVGALCMFGLGLSSLSSSLLRTGSALSLPFSPSIRSFGSKVARMESKDNIVPSIVVYVTVPNKDAGKKLAESIIKERLAACVNIVPGIQSVYHWQGEVQTDSEEMLIIKTRQSLLDPLTEHVKANHEYDTPEVIAMPIIGGSTQYLEWLKNSTRD